MLSEVKNKCPKCGRITEPEEEYCLCGFGKKEYEYYLRNKCYVRTKHAQKR